MSLCVRVCECEGDYVCMSLSLFGCVCVCVCAMHVQDHPNAPEELHVRKNTPFCTVLIELNVHLRHITSKHSTLKPTQETN